MGDLGLKNKFLTSCAQAVLYTTLFKSLLLVDHQNITEEKQEISSIGTLPLHDFIERIVFQRSHDVFRLNYVFR